MFGGEGLFVIEARGAGRLVVASYGSIARYDLQPGEKRKIDDGYMVCWSSDMRWVLEQCTARTTAGMGPAREAVWWLSSTAGWRMWSVTVHCVWPGLV